MNKAKSIFLIEDDEHDQYFFTHAIKSIDDAVLQDIAIDGKEALLKLGRAHILPDLIFTDLHMPRMDGVECITAIMMNPILKKIPIIVLSTDTTRIHIIKDLGARGFIKKTGNLNDLKMMIEQMVHLDYEKDSEIADRTFAAVY